MEKRRDTEGRDRIKQNISRHVDVISLRLSNKEIDDITVNYWAERLKGRVMCQEMSKN